jgi:tetratricopeptide (TPR) repeat protein
MYTAVGEAVPAYWPFQPSDNAILALSIIAIPALTVIFFLLRHRWPAGLATWICYVAILVPVLGIVRIGEQIAADRYSYLAGLGAALLAGGGLIYLWRRWPAARIAAATLAAAVLFALGALTWKQTGVWRDSETLFRYVLAVSPGSKSAHNNLGMVLARRDELDEAMAHFRQSLRSDPDFESPLYNLSLALDGQGQVEEAIQHYRRFLRLDHSHVEFRLVAYHRLGILLVGQGKLAEAAECFRHAIAIQPRLVEAHNNLGLILARQGRLDEAIAHYRKALDLDPEFALAHVNLGDALVLRGELDEAIAHFRAATAAEPDLAAAREGLRLALAQKGRRPEKHE